MTRAHIPQRNGQERGLRAEALPGADVLDSERSFEIIGDRFIFAHMDLRRSQRRADLQRELYLVGGRELTPAQVDALEVVGRRGQCRMREIAAELGVDRSTATRTVAPLVDLGLATRQTDPEDRRSVVLTATASGAATARRITEQRRRLMRAVLGRLAPERRVLLTELMEEYVTVLNEVIGGHSAEQETR